MFRNQQKTALITAERIAIHLLGERPREPDGTIDVSYREYHHLQEGLAVACQPDHDGKVVRLHQR